MPARATGRTVPGGRRVLLHPVEDGWWCAEVPSLPRCISQGATRTEALRNIREATRLCIEVLEEDGDDVPFDDHLDAELAVAG